MNEQNRYNFFRNIFVYYITLFVLGFCTIADAADPPKAFLDPEAILEGWESNYGNMRSMQVSYTAKIVYAKPPETDPNKLDALVKLHHLEKLEKGKLCHVRYSKVKDGFVNPENFIEYAFDGKNTVEYSGMRNLATINPGLLNTHLNTTNHLNNYMLLNIIPSRTQQEEFPDGMPRTNFSLVLRAGISKSRAKVRPHLEFVAGQLCHVVEITHKNKKGKQGSMIWVAHDKGMLPLRYQRYENDRVVKEIEVEQTAMIETDRGDIWYPVKARRTLDYVSRGRTIEEITTKEFIPDVKVDENSFRIVLPNGTQVLDKVLGLQYVVGVADFDEVSPVLEFPATKIEHIEDEAEDKLYQKQNLPVQSKAYTEKDGMLSIAEKDNKHVIKKREEKVQDNTVVSKDHSKRFGASGLVVAIAVIVIICSLFLFLWYRKRIKA